MENLGLEFAAKALRDNAAYFATALCWTDAGQYFQGVLKLAVLGGRRDKNKQ